jgi:hypothetical protein
VSGLGYSKTINISVTPYADRSGDGPTSRGSGTTNPAPPPPAPKVTALYPTGNAGTTGGCTTGDCPFIGYDLANSQGCIRCVFDSDRGTTAWPNNVDDGTAGTHEPRNGVNRSTKYYGFFTGWISVRCTGANGSDFAKRNPWR